MTTPKWSSVDDLMAKEAEHNRLRRFAFISIAISTVALFGSIITLPMIYGYVRELQSQISSEVGYCRFKSQSLWTEVYAIRSVKGARRFERTANSTLREKRAWMFGKWTRDSGQEHVSGYDASPPSSSYRSNPQAPPYKQSSYGSQQVYEPQPPSFGYEQPSAAVQAFEPQPTCCTCQTGPIGDQGERGDEGDSGLDGVPGLSGSNGRNGQILPSSLPLAEPCTICPPGSVGPPGLQGLKGPRGLPGQNGNIGSDGKRGERGMIGSVGPQGGIGPQGIQGIKGESGKIIQLEGPLGPSGLKGSIGDRGRKGQNGRDGLSGKKGAPGQKGEQGLQGVSGRNGAKGFAGNSGFAGSDGECSHCSTPRLPPGY